MAFIKIQNLEFDKDGTVSRGTASIVDVSYVPGGRNHSRQSTRERLGKIIAIAEDRKSGVFMSPTRGLVEYDAVTDAFSSVEGTDDRIKNRPEAFPQAEVHAVFGDSYLLLKFLEKAGLISILRTVFDKDGDYERVLAHVVHGVMRNGSRITCDNFMAKSFASYVLEDIAVASLRTDADFFKMMGRDNTKMAFFRAFIASMRKDNPSFGTGCYIDSTPLPNDIEDNPFNALRRHGVSSSTVQMRLAPVLDEGTGLPVWYFDLTGKNMLELYVPEFFGHGYLVIEDSIVSHKCSEVFYSEGDSGIMYDDQKIGIERPFQLIGGKRNLIISEKDLRLMSFDDYVSNCCQQDDPTDVD